MKETAQQSGFSMLSYRFSAYFSAYFQCRISLTNHVSKIHTW